MKTELRLRPHYVLPDTSVIEVWYDGAFIATVAGADGPGVRVISKHPLTFRVPLPDGRLKVVEVTILGDGPDRS